MHAAQETNFEQAYIALAPRLRWQAGQDVAARAGIQPNRTCRTQLTRRASKCSVDARPAPAPTRSNRCRALLPMRMLQGRSKSRLTRYPALGGIRGGEGMPRLMHGRRPGRLPALAANWARPHACSELAPRAASTHVPYWWVNNPTLGEFCFTMIGRADIEGSKSNVAMNAWLPQASYPCGNFFDTSTFEFRSRIPLVRTSSELAVRRAGKAPEGTVPSPSPGRHAATRSRRGSSSSSPPTADGFGTGTPVPSPQSQSFSRSYGSILLTSLAYIVPSTRGCSPSRPDAVMSTIGRGRHSVLRIFKGRRERTGHHATCGALPAAGPYLRLSRFQGGQAVKQKR
ncbi:hypothetical protein CQW23_34091 [Capsicum baccatum]|uniref:Protein TAR1 n=1 Tax=Capsicum baccatum TaxID=33114 RepID=A0A2G2UZX6_CAPBA|nr:hypothetical protein CQW23_34091 [Capsicum baccatum]